ncbi:MAG: dihydroorotate dehydrogenase electron transfer subunit [Candidatus Zixiibacteriota bacterium]
MTITHTARLVSTKSVGPAIYQQRFHQPTIARTAHAGQFVHMLPDKKRLFRRALSIYAIDREAGTFDVLHQVLGEGTRSLSRLEKGAEVDTLGPLGNRFPSPPKGRRAVLVGGGLGMAPLRLLAYELAGEMTKRARGGEVDRDRLPLMMLGARTKALTTQPYKLSRFDIRIQWATDDGSRGYNGTVVMRLRNEIERGALDPHASVVYGCGPEPMMAALAQECASFDIPCYVSLERSMPCGFGVCMGCVVRRRDGNGYDTYSRVCRDGPVYNAADIIF